MMIQKSIVTVLLVATWLQSCSVVNAAVTSDITRSGGAGLLANVLPGTQSLVSKPMEKRDDSSSSPSDADDSTASFGAKSGTGVATVSGQQSDSPLDAVNKELSNVLKRRSGHDHDDDDNDFRKPSSQSAEAPHGSTKVSLLNLRRRNGLGLNRLIGDKSLHSKGAGSSNDKLLDRIVDLRRRGLLGLGDQASTASSPSPNQGGNSVSLLGRRSGGGDDDEDCDDSMMGQGNHANHGGHSLSLLNLNRRNIVGGGDDGASNSGTSVSLIGKLRRRAVLGTDGLVGSLLAENGVDPSSTDSTQPDDAPTPTEQDDDSDTDKSTENTTQTKKSNNNSNSNDPDNENDIDNDNDTDNDNDNHNPNSNATVNATDNDNDIDNDNDNDNDKNDTDTDSTGNNNSKSTNDDNDSSNNQALDRRSANMAANLPGPSRVARARRQLYTRDNDEDRHIMEDYENLLKEEQERQKQIQEENEDLVKKYGNQQYNGQQYNQQYQPFTGQPYPQFNQGKRAAGSRISLFNLRHRMANGGLVDKA